MRFSVIVPTLNGDYRFDDAKFKASSEVELIVVEGVSPVGKARNEGLKRASGDYVAWIDSDDEVAEDYLERIESSIVAFEKTNGEKPDVVVLDYQKEKIGECVWKESRRGLLGDLIGGRLSPEVWRFVVKRELWEGYLFDEGLKVGEDYQIIPEVLQRAKTWTRVGNVYTYCHNDKSIMRTMTSEIAQECLRLAEVRARRWEGTRWAGDAFAGLIKMAGWMYETGLNPKMTRGVLRANVGAALGCKRLGLWWKIKILILLSGHSGWLKSVYAWRSLRWLSRYL